MTKQIIYIFLCLYCLLGLTNFQVNGLGNEVIQKVEQGKDSTYIVVLGTIQDGGSPHPGCKKKCCERLFRHGTSDRKVVSLGLVDRPNHKTFLLECTPDFTQQAKRLKSHLPSNEREVPDGILLTHAHIGHYSGLMYLGKEALNANAVQVYAMPKMKTFLEGNGPWSQLVTKNNIALMTLQGNQPSALSSNLTVKPILVPHRDEFSETVGFIVDGPHKKALFIPDIDKWEKWNVQVIEMVRQVDYAFIDGTFYDGAEINHRNISEIPHPFIIETMALFQNLPLFEKNKIHFIHLNHTNPALDIQSKAYRNILQQGFKVAKMGQVVAL
jgi:pyrroloquinoline quinone biosynthesis protein B